MSSAPGDRVVSTGVGCWRTSRSLGAAGASARGARLAESTPTRTASGTTPRAARTVIPRVYARRVSASGLRGGRFGYRRHRKRRLVAARSLPGLDEVEHL